MATITEALGYEMPTPNAVQKAMWRISASPAGAWVFARTMPQADRLLLRVSHGHLTIPRLVAGIPVVTVLTTGARTGKRRSTPLLGIPVGGDLAVVGTRFGQPGVPAWYHNMVSHPEVEIRYRDRQVAAVAREADGEEWEHIWSQARRVYAGYEAYARRIVDRPIPIMVLGTAANH